MQPFTITMVVSPCEWNIFECDVKQYLINRSVIVDWFPVPEVRLTGVICIYTPRLTSTCRQKKKTVIRQTLIKTKEAYKHTSWIIWYFFLSCSANIFLLIVWFLWYNLVPGKRFPNIPQETSDCETLSFIKSKHFYAI